MPVEIEELVIRIVVTPPGSPSGGSSRSEEADSRRDELVAEVAEQVLAALRRKEER